MSLHTLKVVIESKLREEAGRGKRQVLGLKTSWSPSKSNGLVNPLYPRNAALFQWRVLGLRLCVFDVVGGSDVQGRGCGLHQRGAGAPGTCPEAAVPRCDAGEFQESGLSG